MASCHDHGQWFQDGSTCPICDLETRVAAQKDEIYALTTRNYKLAQILNRALHKIKSHTPNDGHRCDYRALVEAVQQSLESLHDPSLAHPHPDTERVKELEAERDRLARDIEAFRRVHESGVDIAREKELENMALRARVAELEEFVFMWVAPSHLNGKYLGYYIQICNRVHPTNESGDPKYIPLGGEK